jgi:regulator of PEP synthase PpsR (kinase-PPPase family)
MTIIGLCQGWTSKTPMPIYLPNRGVKTANVGEHAAHPLRPQHAATAVSAIARARYNAEPFR